MFISLAAFIAFEFGQNNLLCNWANEFQPTLHLPSQHSEQLISSQFTFLPFSIVNLKVSFPNLPLLLTKAHFYLFLNSVEGLE